MPSIVHSFFDLRHWTQSKEHIVRFLTRVKFLKSWITCNRCISRCFIKKKESANDGFCFQCSNVTCKKEYNLRLLSPAYRTNYTLFQWYLVIWCFINHRSPTEASSFAKVNESRVRAWYKKFRACISEHLRRNPIIIGRYYIVEIDESCFGSKIKHHRGRNLGREQTWVFGLIERHTGRFVLIVVPDRTANTLIAHIRQYVRVGATILLFLIFFKVAF